MIFQDRNEAAERLAARLASYKGKKPLVLALPRGAVPMAKIIADALDGDLSVVLTRKISVPGYEEYAIGAVSQSGIVYKNPEAAYLAIPESEFQTCLQKQLKVIENRRQKYRLDELPHSAKGRIAILVDDGIATGSTMFAAIRELKSQHPARLIVAAAVAPPDTARKMQAEVDELVLLDQPEQFWAVGQFFMDFREVTDQDVIDTLWPEQSLKSKGHGFIRSTASASPPHESPQSPL
jgi:predicted phosphoribosyltransferase